MNKSRGNGLLGHALGADGQFEDQMLRRPNCFFLGVLDHEFGEERIDKEPVGERENDGDTYGSD